MSLQDILKNVPQGKHRLLITQLLHFLDAEESLLSFAVTDRSSQKEQALDVVRQIVIELAIISSGILDSDALYDISENSEMWVCDLRDWLDSHSSIDEPVEGDK